jgi:hypothetical protein
VAACTATTTAGHPCRKAAIAGGTVCATHGGTAPQVRNAAAIRVAVARWGRGVPTADPWDVLLRAMTVAELRANQHADALDRLVTEHGWDQAFVGEAYVVDENGRTRKVGEYARQLAVWEAKERALAADLAVKAAGTNIAERHLKAVERYAGTLVAVLEATLDELDLGDRKREARTVAARHLRAVESG